MGLEFKLRNGNPFEQSAFDPDPLAQAMSNAVREFMSGGVWHGSDNPCFIEMESGLQDLNSALSTLAVWMSPVDRWADELAHFDELDRLPVHLGAALMDLLQDAEKDDTPPPRTRSISGQYMSIRQHIAAIAIIEADRAITALRNGDAVRVARYTCSAYELFLSMAAIDENIIQESYLDAPLLSAKHYGRVGGTLRHKETRALKDWALAQAAAHRGSDIEIARTLAQKIPDHLIGVSRDPERLIYDALRRGHRSTGRG